MMEEKSYESEKRTLLEHLSEEHGVCIDDQLEALTLEELRSDHEQMHAEGW